MKSIIIAAIGKNNELGKNNDLLWHLPDDFKRFKALTTGHYIIMGRKTFESFPKPLPNRTHVVITRQKEYVSENSIVVSSLNEAYEVCQSQNVVYIIGGGDIYAQAIKDAAVLELTMVNATFDAEVYFPDFSNQDWELVFEEYHPKDERHEFDFTYKTFNRKV
jgi:dihydrofolate reductase